MLIWKEMLKTNFIFFKKSDYIRRIDFINLSLLRIDFSYNSLMEDLIRLRPMFIIIELTCMSLLLECRHWRWLSLAENIAKCYDIKIIITFFFSNEALLKKCQGAELLYSIKKLLWWFGKCLLHKKVTDSGIR